MTACSGDPLHDLIKANPRWRGIFIEPLAELFERLTATYGADDRFAFEQVAIRTRLSERWFYYVTAKRFARPVFRSGPIRSARSAAIMSCGI